MKKMFIAIVVLAIIFVGMIIYKNTMVGTKNNVSIEEVQKIEDYIKKIYMWKEVTGEALPDFEDINSANDLWTWEAVKQNLEEYTITYDEIQQKAKEIFGNNFTKQFPIGGNETIIYNSETGEYYATGMGLDEEEDTFFIKNIEKNKEGYVVEIVEYLEDYSEENSVIIRNLQEEEIGRVSISDSETKMQEIVKNNIERFSKKKVYLKTEENNLIVQKVEK